MKATTGVSGRRTGDRQSAGERRDQVLQAAVAEFAINGLSGTSTEMIARRAGISQPYIFRLFPNKKDLFIAAVGRCFDRVEAAFAAAARIAAGSPREKLHEMGHAYVDLLTRREDLLMQMQGYVACFDPDVRRVVRERYQALQRMTAQVSGATAQEVADFYAKGMFLNVAVCMDLAPSKDLHAWSHHVLGLETDSAAAHRR